MDFRPSAPQQLLVATARDYLRRHCPIERVQALAGDPRGMDDTLWRGMAELGWQGLLVPAAHGGSGGSLLDALLLVEAMGGAAVPGPFIPSAVVATSLLAAGAEEPRKRLLPAMAVGDRIATVAIVEERGTFDPDAITLTPDARGRVTGRKLFVPHAHVADDILVVLRDGVVIVPADRPGLARTPLDTLSGEKLFALSFDGVALGGDDWLVRGGRDAVVRALEAGALARTAEMVGLAQRALDITVEHAKTRVQGGRPIGGHQAIQHACADLVRDVDASRALLYVAGWEASARRDAGGAIATAKAYAGEACLAVARRGHQILGAISYCDEHPMHLVHKRIHAASLDCGDAALHLETVARAIGLES